MSLSHIREMVKSWGQEHVLKYIDSGFVTDEKEIATFLKQIETVDFPRVCALLKAAKQGDGENVYSPPAPEEIFMRSSRSKETETLWWNLGMKAIREGKVAVTILAGGQGTRMGLAVDESKGMLCLDQLPSKKYVFQLFIERLERLRSLAGDGTPCIPLLIMTSPINNDKVESFLKEHKFFGHENVRIFSQGTLPALTTNGDLLLESHARLAISPDGNGGVYNALVLSGTMAALRAAGVEHLHVIAVDNAIARPADPLLIGACISASVEIGNKVVWKSDWREKVGVIAKKNGKNSVVEYSDLYNPELKIDNPMIRAVDSDNNLLFGAGNICNHYYSIKGLEKILPKVTSNYHLAVKKIMCVNMETDQIEKPVKNNGLKLESFIFDAFELASSGIIVEANRAEEFSPMKNPIGDDSPESAVEQMRLAHRNWLLAAGAILKGGWIEITPEISYAGEGLEGFKGIEFKDEKTIINKEWVKKYLK